MPLSKETHHLVLTADFDAGHTFKDAQFFCWAFEKAVGQPVWVPLDIDTDFEITTADASAQANFI